MTEPAGPSSEGSTLADHVGKSGAGLERRTLDDGRTVVVKRIARDSDLTLGIFGGAVSPEYLLWRSGALDRLPPGVGHAILDGWTEGADTTVIVMRDLNGAVLTWQDRLDARACSWMLARVSALHRAYLGEPPGAVVPLLPLLEMFAPERITEAATAGNELMRTALRGWEYFADPAMVPPEVTEQVFRMHADAQPLVDALTAGPVTLAHGDLATVNMAFEGDRLILLDWAMPVAAPGALDVARFLVGCGHVVDLEPDAVLDTYRHTAGPAYDEEVMGLALFSALCWLGWNKAVDIVESPDQAVRERERKSLGWWVARARRTLESPGL
jgi:hypothetical protein